MFLDLKALTLILGGDEYVEDSLELNASSFYIRMHEGRTCKWCRTKCNPSLVLGNPTGALLPNGKYG